MGSVPENRLYRANIFHVSLSADLLCQFSMFRVYCYYCISKYFRSRRIGTEFIQETLVGMVKEAIEGLIFLGVCLCLSSSYYFVCTRSSQPYRWLNIYPPEQGARICFDYDCSDNQVQVKGTENSQRMYRLQIFIALDAACTVRQLSNAFLVALTQALRAVVKQSAKIVKQNR